MQVNIPFPMERLEFESLDEMLEKKNEKKTVDQYIFGVPPDQ